VVIEEAGMTSPVRCLGFLALGTLLIACFDVQQIAVSDDQAQTQGLLVDDFEDGDWLPASPLFLHWFCQWGKAATCGVSSPGSSYSRNAYALTFKLVDQTTDGVPDYPPVWLRTWRSGERLDFTRYENLIFSAKLVPAEGGQDLSSTTVEAELSCPGEGEASDQISTISSGVQPGNGWQTYKLRLADFKWRQNWQGPQVDASGCLTRTDGVGFKLQPTLLDGETATGTLMVDNVYLR
jgi:hypothetical protein